jgi:hypothetical protein
VNRFPRLISVEKTISGQVRLDFTSGEAAGFSLRPRCACAPRHECQRLGLRVLFHHDQKILA